VPLNVHLLDRLALQLEREPEPPLYGRFCDRCGHVELSEYPLLLISHRECPSCTVRRRGNHGRT
jgi:hypothetical protein